MDSVGEPVDATSWRSPEPRFLDYYGDAGIRLVLERYGFVAEAKKRGFVDLRIQCECDEERHTLIVSGVPEDGVEPERIAEAVVRRDVLVSRPIAGSPELPPLDATYQVLTIDWLSLRNPRGVFTPERPRLPGQDVPGLGLAEQVFELLCRAVERLRLDALLSTAEYFHNAVLYVARMPFLDPRCGGRVQSLIQLLLYRERLSLAQASWAVEWGMVREQGAAEPFRWRGEAQVWPRAPSLRAYLGSDAYFAHVGKASAGFAFTLDRAAFDARWQIERDPIEGRAPAGGLTGVRG